MTAAHLGPAPDSPVTADGRPAVGAYAGHVTLVSWDGLRGAYARGALFRRFHAKRWHYVSLAGAECLAAFAIVDLGYAASAFAYVLDRRERRLLCDHSFTGLPGAARVAATAGPGARSSFSGGGAELLLEQPRETAAWRVQARGPGGFLLEATLDTAAAPPTLCAIAPIADGVANCTHKTVCLPAAGHVAVGATRRSLDGAWAALDHTSGLLARDTRWRWASASGPGVGFNLVAGFNGPVENAIWVDGRLHKVGAAELEYDAQATSRPWRVRTVDGAVDLEFRPEGERREDKDLLVARSWYVQPIGTFHGTLRPGDGEAVAVDGLLGVTEDHVAKW